MAIQQSQKFTPEELESIKVLQAKTSNLTFKFGQLHLNKIRLKNQEEILNNEIKQIEEEESQLAQEFSKKYGKGSIDITTGEFTPSE
jgi:hypothetical protein